MNAIKMVASTEFVSINMARFLPYQTYRSSVRDQLGMYTRVFSGIRVCYNRGSLMKGKPEMEHARSPFYTTAEFASMLKRRPRSVLAVWRKNNAAYGVTPIKIGERVMWPKDQVNRTIQGSTENLGLKCLHCGSDSLFFEPVSYERGTSCKVRIWCNYCRKVSTLTFGNFGACRTESKEDLNSNMAFNRDDDYDHFAFHADEEKQNGN
jgi:hypothetical protein